MLQQSYSIHTHLIFSDGVYNGCHGITCTFYAQSTSYLSSGIRPQCILHHTHTGNCQVCSHSTHSLHMCGWPQGTHPCLEMCGGGKQWGSGEVLYLLTRKLLYFLHMISSPQSRCTSLHRDLLSLSWLGSPSSAPYSAVLNIWDKPSGYELLDTPQSTNFKYAFLLSCCSNHLMLVQWTIRTRQVGEVSSQGRKQEGTKGGKMVGWQRRENRKGKMERGTILHMLV